MVKRGIELRSYSSHVLFLLNHAAVLVQWNNKQKTVTQKKPHKATGKVWESYMGDHIQWSLKL